MKCDMSGNLYIVSAPSGAGKTSLVRALLDADPKVHLSISHTTRPPRPGETDGRDYFFISKEDFIEMEKNGEFLESAHVHGNRYGTSRKWIEEERKKGNDILLEIDWQGAAQVRKLVGNTIGIFILPPSIEALRERLKGRGQDSMEVIERRVAAAREEMGHVDEFDYVIINDDMEEAKRDLVSIVRAERLKKEIQIAAHREMIKALI
ncbi:MAG TPA: guanylate kinase [Burkholderiales bacterium]|nr:guanylate kinase [Burkholderiales bacterium]